MLLPELFGDTFGNWMNDDAWNTRWFYTPSTDTARKMSTDIRETENGYELDMELPGFKKEDVHAELKNGYMTITAAHTENNDQKDENGKYIRRERYTGSFRRSFYVGENVEPEHIKAKFEDGVLKLAVPKNVQPKVEEKKTIAIEG